MRVFYNSMIDMHVQEKKGMIYVSDQSMLMNAAPFH